ncbi:MAG: hypothetical protein EX269_07015 [Acidimicrobiales bacterium]|nr:MAG: hypothetical protein EX269_07015 [Acidimicrobiales bacterium]
MSRTISIIFALLLAVTSACSDGVENAEVAVQPAESLVSANTSAPVVEEQPEEDVEAVEETTTTTEPPAAPTTSTTSEAPPTTIPRALAFTSAADVGTFFETESKSGMLITSTEAGGGAGDEIIEDGTVVQALEMVELQGYSWVLVSAPFSSEPIGWLLAADLIETEQLITTMDVAARGRYHRVDAGGNVLVVHVEPSAESAVEGSYATGEIVFHSGETVAIPDGSSWAKILDPSNLRAIGWVNADFITMASGVLVHNADGSPALTSRGNWDSGARITTPVQKTATCAFVQLEIGTTGSGNISSHVMYGSTAPTSPDDGQPEFQQWDMGSDTGLVFIRPGDSVLFTLPAHPVRTYYFMAIGPEGDAPFVADADGAPIVNAAGRMVASDFITFTADGTC